MVFWITPKKRLMPSWLPRKAASTCWKLQRERIKGSAVADELVERRDRFVAQQLVASKGFIKGLASREAGIKRISQELGVLGSVVMPGLNGSL